MATIPPFETLRYEESDAVAWVTLDRPEVHNAFNSTMQLELRTLWRLLRRHDPVRVVVLTGAGDRAFCTGIDRDEALGGAATPAGDGGPPPAALGGEPVSVGAGTTPFMFDDPGENLGPKTCDLWKPVIAAVNGMACGGAFYLLGEVDFIIAVESATFFDPHVTYGMAAAFEPLQMSGRLPFGELARLTLLGASERMSAARAHQVGLVSELASDLDDLRDRASWAASAVASAPPLAVQGSLRALWAGRELGRSQALALGYAFVGLGNDARSLAEGQAAFASGRRADWRLR
ncbi:MAG: enoyl-CoA hydratase/isomerase family protein [Actinomycetota bacterium]|jgi:enoyl-CoA hydratase/carnithine racemase|nr:enoyl-CoA hydratase/isomerase family protein [Actinomycetota bacterium]